VRRRSIIVGSILVAAYLVVLAATVGLRDGHLRPLYDGFDVPAPYRWVDPPPFFAAGNVTPDATTVPIALGRDGSVASGAATPDGQFVLNFAQGAVPPHAGARHVVVKISPADPGALAPVPTGLRANGNAYRVEMTYEPGGEKVDALARPGSVVIEIPEVGSDLFTSPDGATWSKLVARTVPPRQLSLAATFDRPGYFLGATTLPELVGPTDESSDHSVAIGLGAAGLAAIVLIGAFWFVRRRRQRRTPA
jgi:hypothetical protein